MGVDTISRRESSALMNSLTAGVVPRIGLRHIAVGRKLETEALLHDLANIEDGGASFRLITGQYGSGKSFLLQMIRNNAMERGFVVADADLSPERRFTGAQGQGVATYRELAAHISTLPRPDGGALESILQKWINGLQFTAMKELGLQQGAPDTVEAVSVKIAQVMTEVSEMTCGFAFGTAIDSYWRGMKTGDEDLKQSALRWLRGEFSTKTEAKRRLAVDCIIDDQNWYEFLKLFALFVAKATYKGLLIILDEGVNLYKISNRQARENNYEKILTLFNDTMQGRARHLGVFLSGTPDFVDDERRGLFSYEALRSRLAGNRFAGRGFVDYTSPVIRLAQLTNEELYVLLERLRALHQAHYSSDHLLDDGKLAEFLAMAVSRMGAEKLLTPREITRDFLGLLTILHQNPTASFDQLVGDQVFPVTPAGSDPERLPDHDDELFSDFEV